MVQKDDIERHSMLMRPGKVIALHLNYPSRIAQRGRFPQQPSYFLKPASSVSASGTPIIRPAGTELLAFEGEIAVIIGRVARGVSIEDGWAHVSGVTAANDFGVYDLRWADKGSNLRSKGGDGYTPLGPSIIPASEIDPTALRLRTWVNGELMQDDTTAELLFPFGRLIADLSQLITLEPGDVILTGTPAGSSVVQPGDTVEVEVDAPSASGSPTTGRLITPVIAGDTELADFGARANVDEAQRIEAWGSREAAGISGPFSLTAELKGKIASVSTATISSQLRKRGLNNVSIDGVSSTHPEKKLVGRARTLRYVANREDLFEKYGNGYNAQKRSIDTLDPGDVLVMEARGERGTGTIGDILALRAQVRGAAGIVTDGAARDATALAELELPIYFANPHPAVLGRKHIPWDIDLTISCGGATVQPGDVIVGDGDGVLVIPPALVEEVIDASLDQENQERFILEQVRAGERVDSLYPLGPAWKERYAAWLKEQ